MQRSPNRGLWTSLDTVMGSHWDQFYTACSNLRADPVFREAKEISLVGHSNGGLIARMVAQNRELCFNPQRIPGKRIPRIKHFVSSGTPHNGTTLEKKCNLGRLEGSCIQGLLDHCITASNVVYDRHRNVTDSPESIFSNNGGGRADPRKIPFIAMLNQPPKSRDEFEKEVMDFEKSKAAKMVEASKSRVSNSAAQLIRGLGMWGSELLRRWLN